MKNTATTQKPQDVVLGALNMAEIVSAARDLPLTLKLEAVALKPVILIHGSGWFKVAPHTLDRIYYSLASHGFRLALQQPTNLCSDNIIVGAREAFAKILTAEVM